MMWYNKSVKRLLFLLSVVLVLLPGIANAAPPSGVILFTWYDEYRWNPSPVKTVDTPVEGRYRSDDVNVRRKQLTQIRDAGFDFVILDWWFEEPYGKGDYIRSNSLLTARMIEREFPTLKFTFLWEPRPWAGSTVPYYAYQDMYNFFGESPNWFRWGGRITTLAYNTEPTYHPKFHTAKYDNVSTAGNTVYWMLHPPRLKNGVLTIFPAFSNYAWCQGVTSCLIYDGGWSGQVFNEQTAYAKQQKNSLIFLVTYGWNEYYERSQIEPNYRPDSARGPTYMLDLFRQFNARWKA